MEFLFQKYASVTLSWPSFCTFNLGLEVSIERQISRDTQRCTYAQGSRSMCPRAHTDAHTRALSSHHAYTQHTTHPHTQPLLPTSPPPGGGRAHMLHRGRGHHYKTNNFIKGHLKSHLPALGLGVPRRSILFSVLCCSGFESGCSPYNNAINWSDSLGITSVSNEDTEYLVDFPSLHQDVFVTTSKWNSLRLSVG